MLLSRFLIFSISFICLLMSTLSAKSAEKKGTKYALLVGVNKYDRNQLTSLQCPVNDVTAFRKVLIENCELKSENIQLLTLAEAGRVEANRKVPSAKNIREELTSLIQLCD